MEDTILSCPFCGNGAVYPEEGGSGPIKEVYVYCPNCMARGPVVYRHHRSYEYCKEQATMEWNRRNQ